MIAHETREEAAENVKRTIAFLEAHECSIHKIALICERDWSTVRNWKRTGRIEHFDWLKLSALAETLRPSSIPFTPLRP